jgi:hypothetical protein
MGERGYCEVCGAPTKFQSITVGYIGLCSQECKHKSQKVKDKMKKTCIETYGCENPSQSELVKDKKKKSSQARYGCDYVFQAPEVIEKIQRVINEKYGGSHMKNAEVIEKQKETCRKKYGTEYSHQNKEIIEKTKQTCIERYGVPAVASSKHVKDILAKKYFELLLSSDRLKDRCIPNFTPGDYQGTHHKYSWSCTTCKSVFEDHLDNGHIPHCPVCYPGHSGSSFLEKELVDFIKRLGVIVEESNHSILGKKEIDVFIPFRNLAIEFDGLYWHSELRGVGKNYHLDKTITCREKGIQLIHIFEDEWIYKKEIVKSMIQAKLGLCDRLYARNCTIKDVSTDDAKLFLFDNHLKGYINGKNLGLYHDDLLVSLLTYGSPRFDNNHDVEIFRFCSKRNMVIVGGLSKLLKGVGNCTIITYCDIRFGEGDSYIKGGLRKIGVSQPSYYYIKGDRRLNRLEFQKHLLKDKLKIFDHDLTEWQNMQLNGYNRIWDCGNNIFSNIQSL